MKSNRIIHNLSLPLFLLLFSVAAFATDYGDISVKVEALTGGNSNNNKPGIEEYRATIINRSPVNSHRVTVALNANGVREVRRGAELAPDSTAALSLFISSDFYDEITVEIDGAVQKERVEADQSRVSAWVNTSRNAYYLLASRDVEKSGLMKYAALVEGFKASDGQEEVAYLNYPSPVQEWSSNWLGYSSFDGVLVSGDEWRAMPDGVRSAVLGYVENGGLLAVVGSFDEPAHWRARRMTLKSDSALGGSTTAAKPTAESGAQSFVHLWAAGFGVVIATNAADPAAMSKELWAHIKSELKRSRPIQKEYYQLSQINYDFPVADRLGIPVRGLFALMLGFVILIGPINLFWLARRRKKLWLLWTAPAISLLTCLAVAAFALFGEGFSATLRTEALTILDETSHRAATLGWTAFYTPVAPADGLHFSYDTELYRQTPGYGRYSDNGESRTIDLTNDKHLTSGWIAARVPSYFRVRKNESRRERLTIERLSNDSIRVVNGLGADIQKLWVADRGGRIYAAQDIKAGARADFSAINLQATGSGSELRDIYNSVDWLAQIKLVEQDPEQYLMPGSYLAVTETSPFVEEALRDVKTRKGRSMVYGISAEAAR